MKKIKKEKINAYIISMYIFQFGFLQPLVSLLNSRLIVLVFSTILLIVLLINNKFKFKKFVICFFLIIGIFFLLMLISLDNSIGILLIYIEFLVKGFSGLLIGSIDFNGESLYKSFTQLGLINFMAIFTIPFIGQSDTINYMRFGYAMVPSVLIFFYKSYDSKFKNYFWNSILLISLVLCIVYGSRGVIILISLFIILVLLFQDINFSRKMLLIFISICILYVFVKFEVLIKIVDYIYYKIGIQSYSLNKIRIMLTSGLAASSSGRDIIYLDIINMIKRKPIFGYGLGITQETIGYTAHNIILQILVETGVVGLLIWSLIWIFSIKKYVQINNDNLCVFRILTILISISIGRLLISSDMWLRPEYWVSLSMLISYRKI